MEWLDRVKQNILPVSQEKINVKKALDEWEYRGVMFDLEYAEETCQLCDQIGLRYQFEIINKFNRNTLLIGSECITRFKIGVIDESGSRLSHEEAKRKVSKDKNKLITAAITKSVINSLLVLASKDESFDIHNFIQYYNDRGAFTPNQLSTLIWRLEKHGVDFNRNHFKLTIKRNREKEQLLNMPDWKVRELWPSLSSSQKTFFVQKKNNGEIR